MNNTAALLRNFIAPPKTKTEAPEPTRGNAQAVFKTIRLCEIIFESPAEIMPVFDRSALVISEGANRFATFKKVLRYLINEGYIIEIPTSGPRRFSISTFAYFAQAQTDNAPKHSIKTPITKLSRNENFMLVAGFLLSGLSIGISATTAAILFL